MEEKKIRSVRTRRGFRLPPALAGLAAACLLWHGLSSCAGGSVYESSVSIPDGIWAYGDTLSFVFGMEDTTGTYAMYLRVRHTAAYPYRNLYTEFLTAYPGGRTVNQVVSLELADATGRSNGNCRGAACEVEIPLQAKAVFREQGTYRLSLVQYMRQDSLPGLSQVELVILPAETE